MDCQDDSLRLHTVSCGVREATATEVDICAVILNRLGAYVVLEIVLDGTLLVPGPREVETESTRRTDPCDFWFERDGTAYASEIRAGRGEDGIELRDRAVLRQARGTGTLVS